MWSHEPVTLTLIITSAMLGYVIYVGLYREEGCATAVLEVECDWLVN